MTIQSQPRKFCSNRCRLESFRQNGREKIVCQAVDAGLLSPAIGMRQDLPLRERYRAAKHLLAVSELLAA
jgi:hypothetical protein